MPEPVRSNQRYLPGLDGLRALAVGAVVAYHIGFGWAQGGLLGVGVFFTLSGYLITDLLLCQQEMTGGLQFADFWLRRARRLLPALFLMLAVVVAWVTLLERSLLPAIRGAVAASALYVNNWWLIAQHSSYFAQFGPPSPVGHLWSLAVEEQFYLIWPWLLWIGLRLRRGRSGTNTRLAVASLLLAAASAVTLVLASCGMAGVVQPNSANPTGGTPSAAVGTRSPPARTATGRSRVPARGPARTMCRAVVHIGDSTSDGLISPDYLPNPQERIAAQYERVGVTKFIPEISGARSIVETYHGQPNAYTVAQQLI